MKIAGIGVQSESLGPRPAIEVISRSRRTCSALARSSRPVHGMFAFFCLLCGIGTHNALVLGFYYIYYGLYRGPILVFEYVGSYIEREII